MKLIDKFLIGSVILLSAIFFNACSSSSGSIRYNTDSNEKIVERTSSPRYTTQPNVIEEDSSFIEDEEIPESQDPSDLPDDEQKIDLAEVMKKIDSNSNNSETEKLSATKRDLVLMEIIKYLDTPYKFGGNSLNGIDCSAFTQIVFKNTSLCELNRSAREQYKQGLVIKDRSQLKFGDLVFFNTRRRVKPGHVGIYIGDNLFAHASSKFGVTISSLDYAYYSKRYMGARRVNAEDLDESKE